MSRDLYVAGASELHVINGGITPGEKCSSVAAELVARFDDELAIIW